MKNHDTFIGRTGIHTCEKCGKEIQTVWGSTGWHLENDPLQGYCTCIDNPLREMVDAARKHMQNEEAQPTITSLQAQLAERDKTILEQQLRIEELRYWLGQMQRSAGETKCDILGIDRVMVEDDNLSALEAHDREVRIKCLEDAAKWFDAVEYENINNKFECDYAEDQIRRMANELKEQS